MPRELVFLLFVIALVAIFCRYAADRRHVRELQQEATRAFEGLVLKSADDRYQLLGSKAIVERREETGGIRGILESTASLAVTIYARNEHGEKFVFMWHSKSRHQPFVKHLPRQTNSPGTADTRPSKPNEA